MFKYFEQFKDKRGAIALLLVIMITTLTLVSSIVLSMINTSDMMSNYHLSEAVNVNVGIDSCMEDALFRISSSSDISGTYNINIGDTNCEYEIGATASGLKTVTTTASTTSGIGYWTKTITTIINVSTSPISIESYKDSVDSFDSFIIAECGDGVTEGSEVCDDGNTINETQTCGNNITENGSYCNSDCTAEIILTEVCDDNNTTNEGCGNGVLETAGTYCNYNCTAEIVIGTSETCDYTGSASCGTLTKNVGVVGCGKNPICTTDCSSCVPACL